MPYSAITVEVSDHIATITLNRPEKLNALNDVLRDDLQNVSAEVRANDDIRAVIVTGSGRGFCSGADLTAGAAADEAPAIATRIDEYGWVGRLATAIYQIGVPSIAVINGVAAGAGMSLSLACDMRVGHTKSRFKTVFAERSLSPDTGMSYFLPRIVGYSRAADLIFTSRDVFGEEAYRMGLLDRLVDEADMMTTAREIASQVAALAPVAIQSGKRVLQQNMERGFDEALRNETIGLQFAGRAKNDRKEQALAFREKRAPKFTGT